MIALLFVLLAITLIAYLLIGGKFISSKENPGQANQPTISQPDSTQPGSKQIKLVILSLRLMVFIHLVVALLPGYFAVIGLLNPKYYDLGFAFLVITLFFLLGAALNLWLVQEIKGFKFWSWVIGIATSILFLPTGFFSIPAGFALYGLLHPETRAAIQAARLRRNSLRS